MKIVCVLALPNHSSWTPSMQIVQGYFHLVSKVPMNKQFNSIHIYRGWSISKRSAEKSNQQTMFSRLESKETKGRGEREGDNRKRSSTRRSVPRREQLQREIFNFCGEQIEKALLAPLALLRGTNLDIWSEWSRSRWKKAWGQCPWSTELIGLSAFLFSIKTILIPLKPQALPKGFKFYKQTNKPHMAEAIGARSVIGHVWRNESITEESGQNYTEPLSTLIGYRNGSIEVVTWEINW